MSIEIVKNENFLIFKRTTEYYLVSIISILIISISAFSLLIFRMKDFLKIQFSMWSFPAFMAIILIPIMILIFLYTYIRDMRIGYLLKFDLLTKTILRNKKILFLFDDIDYIVINRKIVQNKMQNNVFLNTKNGKKESILFYDNENDLIEAVNEIKKILNVEVKEE